MKPLTEEQARRIVESGTPSSPRYREAQRVLNAWMAHRVAGLAMSRSGLTLHPLERLADSSVPVTGTPADIDAVAAAQAKRNRKLARKK